MPIPKVVQDIADAAEARRVALFETHAAPAVQATETPTPAPAPEAPAPTPPAAAPAPVATPPVAPAEQPLEHRYSVLQGKYNAEVPRLNATVRDLKRSSDEKDSVIAQLREQLKANTKPRISQEEIEQHGEGTVDLMRRVAQDVAAPLNETIEQQRAQLERIQGASTKAKVSTFWETLAQAHPDWAVINGDAVHFHPFLDQYNPLAGKTYQELLEDAQAAGNAAQATEVFTAFKRARDSKVANANTALDQLVVPGPGAPAPTPVDPTQKRIISPNEVEAHYKKLRRAEYPSMEAANAAEAEIQLAAQEGRIR